MGGFDPSIFGGQANYVFQVNYILPPTFFKNTKLYMEMPKMPKSLIISNFMQIDFFGKVILTTLPIFLTKNLMEDKP